MEKIPTLFKRDPEDMRRVLPEVTPGCEWVLAGEGTATRKYDGTCCLFSGGEWFARREVKPGKEPPQDFWTISTDPNTGKTVGWVPMEQSSFAKWHAEALDTQIGSVSGDYDPGTYELIGPKVNGNPERAMCHQLVRHANACPVLVYDVTYDGLRKALLTLHVVDGMEGIVWHHPDGRMAKLKARDFPGDPK